MERFYAVATNMDKVRSDPQLSMLDWIDMKTKNNFVNMKQVHFADKQKAIELYDQIKNKDIIVFKNWT
jgi:hypothetical protein